MSAVVIDTMRVLQFVKQYAQVSASEGMVGIGLEKGGVLVAGVLFYDYTRQAIWGHVAAVPGRDWLNRKFLRACFKYPFEQLGVKTFFGWVQADNAEARRFDEHLGFKQCAFIEGAGADGTDVVIYRMNREDCRYVDPK